MYDFFSCSAIVIIHLQVESLQWWDGLPLQQKMGVVWLFFFSFYHNDKTKKLEEL
jgi:hypothetical protein